MKKNSHNEENHNLVMFPSAKNFKSDLENEFQEKYEEECEEEITSVQYTKTPNCLDERFESELDAESFHSLEAFMNRHQAEEFKTQDDCLVQLIDERLRAIKEAEERIKFYFDEIEMFLPSRKK